MPVVCAVTVTYADRFEALCKPTIERAFRAGVDRIVVVDNGSTLSSAQSLRAFSLERPKVMLISREHNEGSAAAFGIALAAATDTHPDFIWLLDDDNWVEPSTLEQLLKVQAEAATRYDDPLTAVCASREPNGFHERVRAGASVDSVYPPVGAFLSFDLWSYLARRVRKPTTPTTDSPAIPYAPYGGLLIHNDILTQVGPPRKDFVLYADDTYWTSQIVRCGHRIVLATGVLISDADRKWLASDKTNSVASIMQKDHPARLYLSTRNQAWVDHQRLRHGAERVRYAVNRLVITTVAWISARRNHSMQNFSLFRSATMHAEAGDLSHSPRLKECG